MEIQIDNVPMTDAPPAAAAPDPERRARTPEPEAVELKPINLPTIEDDPRTAMAKAAREGRRTRILQEVMADPGTAGITQAFDDTAEGDPADHGEYTPRVVHEHDPPVASEPIAPAAPQSDDVRLVVYGQEVMVNRAEVEARGGPVEAQKQLAAEVQFRRNSDVLRDAEEKLARAEAIQRANDLLAAELQNKMRGNPSTPTEGTALPGNPDAAVGSEDSPGRQIVEQIFAGDMDSAAKALDNLLKPDRLSKVVDQTLQQREAQQRESLKQQEQVNAKQAVNRLMAEKHADVLADPALKAHARTEFDLMRAKPENQRFSLAEIADVAAQTVKSRFGSAPAPAVQQTDPMADRRQLKSSMSFTPNMGAAPAAAPAPQQTRSTVVQRMREARGLPN